MIFIRGTLLGVVFSIDLLDFRPGLIVFEVTGNNAWEAFRAESGGHRFQRIPPTERRGRVQTSTITVVAFKINSANSFFLNEKELRWDFQRGSGKGGQHKNKTDTCVRLTHLPTKLSVRIDGRSQNTNKQKALEILTARVENFLKNKKDEELSLEKKNKAGSGQRGDKIRTIRVRDNVVTNHLTGKKTTYSKYISGDFGELC